MRGGCVLQKVRKRFAPDAERLIAQIFAIEEQQIEDVIDQRDTSRAFE
jgi:hypothetical protein